MRIFKMGYLIIALIMMISDLWGQCHGAKYLLAELPTTKGFCEGENCLKGRANRHFYVFYDKSTLLTDVTDSVEIKYDDKDRVVELIDYIEEYGTSEFEPYIKYLFQYNEASNQIIRTEQKWVDENWLTRSRIIFHLDEEDNETKLVTEIPSTQNEWIKTEQIRLFYNDNRQLIHYIEEFFGASDWFPSLQHQFEYDNKGNLLHQSVEAYHSGSWELQCETYFEFDDLNNKTRERRTNWLEGEVVREVTDSIERDTLDKQITINYFSTRWSGAFRRYEREIFIFNDANQLTEHYYNYTSVDLENWFHHLKTVFHYTEQTNQIEKKETFYNYEIDEPDWNLVNVESYFYNEHNLLDSVIGNLYRDEEWYPYPVEKYEFDETGLLLLKKEYQNNFIRESAVISREEVIFYYNDVNQLTSLDPNVLLADFFIYPNPTTDFLYIKSPFDQSAELILYNSMGVLVKRVNLTKNHQEIPIADLAKGIYFAYLSNQKGYTIQKIIVD